MFSDPTLSTENDGPKLRCFRDSLVNDKVENNNMATAASSGTISRRPHLLDNAPNYLGIWVNYPKEIIDNIHIHISKTKWIGCCEERDIWQVEQGFSLFFGLLEFFFQLKETNFDKYAKIY